MVSGSAHATTPAHPVGVVSRCWPCSILPFIWTQRRASAGCLRIVALPFEPVQDFSAPIADASTDTEAAWAGPEVAPVAQRGHGDADHVGDLLHGEQGSSLACGVSGDSARWVMLMAFLLGSSAGSQVPAVIVCSPSRPAVGLLANPEEERSPDSYPRRTPPRRYVGGTSVFTQVRPRPPESFRTHLTSTVWTSPSWSACVHPPTTRSNVESQRCAREPAVEGADSSTAGRFLDRPPADLGSSSAGRSAGRSVVPSATPRKLRRLAAVGMPAPLVCGKVPDVVERPDWLMANGRPPRRSTQRKANREDCAPLHEFHRIRSLQCGALAC